MALADRAIKGGDLIPVVLVNPAGLMTNTPLPVTAPFFSVEVTLALDAGNIYAIGDVFSNTIEIPNAVRTAGGRSLLHSLVVYDLDDQGFGIDFYLLRANVSLGTRNAAPSIGDPSVVNVLGLVRVTSSDLQDLGASRVAVMSTIGQMVEAAAGSTSVFLGTLVQGAGTYTASGVKVRFDFLPE